MPCCWTSKPKVDLKHKKGPTMVSFDLESSRDMKRSLEKLMTEEEKEKRLKRYGSPLPQIMG